MSRRNTAKRPPRTFTLCTVIEALETRAMLASVGPESWSAPGLVPAPLGTGSLFSSGIILTCSSPTPGSSGTSSPPAPAAGSGGTTSGGDLWLSYSAGSGAGGSTSGSTGGLSTNGPALSSQYTGGSGVGGQGNGTVGPLTNADLWRLYWSGAGAGSSSGSANGSLVNDPTISARYTGGSGGGMVFFVTGATGADAASSGSQQGTTGSNTLTLADGQSPVMTTPLVYQPGSDDGPGVVTAVWTGGEGDVQFIRAANTATDGNSTSESSSLIATIGGVAGDVGSYVGRSSKSLILGDWTDEKPTELSIGAGIGLGGLGVDLPLDIRDLSHPLTHREWSYKWGETLAYNTIGLIPLIGVIKNLKNAKKLKYLDDAGELAKRTADATDAAGDAGRRAPPASDPSSQPPSKAPSGPQEPRGPLFIGTPNGRVFRIPEGWVGRPADKGKGIVFQRPGADGNSDMIRIMDPTPDKPGGYFRYYNSYGQPLDPFGKPGRESATHIPIDYEGPLPKWTR